MSKYGDLTLKDYSELSKKENSLILIAVYKDKAVYSAIEKEAFKTIPNLQQCVCQSLMEKLDSLKSVRKDKTE